MKVVNIQYSHDVAKFKNAICLRRHPLKYDYFNLYFVKNKTIHNYKFFAEIDVTSAIIEKYYKIYGIYIGSITSVSKNKFKNISNKIKRERKFHIFK